MFRTNKLSPLFVCIFLFVGCSRQTEINSAQFNDEARNFFAYHFDSLDLSPLTEYEKCRLREAVRLDLDSLDDFSFNVLDDRYLIKTYFEYDEEIRFSIVKDLKNGTFYFLCIPHFHKLLYVGAYHESKENKYGLKIARKTIKVNAPLYNSLIDTHVPDPRRPEFSWRLIRATMPEFPAGGNISVEDFKTKIQREYDLGLIAESSLKKLTDILDSTGYGNQEIVFIERIGYLILVFDKVKDDVSFYFFPEENRLYVSKAHHSGNLSRRCL